MFFGESYRRLPGLVCGVGFWRARHIEHGLRQREFAFGRAQKIIGVLGGVRDDERLRIGQPDVLHRHAHHAATHEQRVFASVQHPREIV